MYEIRIASLGRKVIFDVIIKDDRVYMKTFEDYQNLGYII